MPISEHECRTNIKSTKRAEVRNKINPKVRVGRCTRCWVHGEGTVEVSVGRAEMGAEADVRGKLLSPPEFEPEQIRLHGAFNLSLPNANASRNAGK